MPVDGVALAVFGLALLVAAGSPGPSIVALVARVLADGWRPVLPFLAAMWVGELVWLTCAMAGLGTLAERFHAVFVALKWAGVAYLAWLAWRLWRAPAGPADPLPARRGWGMFGAGLALTLGNPKIMVFYLALLPGLVDLTAVTPTSWAVTAVVALGVLVAVDLAWMLAADRARRLLRSPRALRLANRLSAGMMGGAAVWVASRG